MKSRLPTREIMLARGCALLIGVALVALAHPAEAQDLLVLRAGGRRPGALLSCISDRCTLGGESVPRAEIAWIGVGVDPASSPPAPPADPGLDAVQLADGALHPAPLVGINATTVVTQRGSHLRTEVDWIYLAPPARGADSTPGEEWVGFIDSSLNASKIGRINMTVTHDGQGNLTGQMAGETSAEVFMGECMAAHSPQKFSANLVGQYTPGRRMMSLTMTELMYQQASFIFTCGQGGGPYPIGVGLGHPQAQPILEQILRNLAVAADGSVQATWEETTGNANQKAELTLRRVE